MTAEPHTGKPRWTTQMGRVMRRPRPVQKLLVEPVPSTDGPRSDHRMSPTIADTRNGDGANGGLPW